MHVAFDMLIPKAVSFSIRIVVCIVFHEAPGHFSRLSNLCDISHPTVTTQRTRRRRSKRSPAVRMFHILYINPNVCDHTKSFYVLFGLQVSERYLFIIEILFGIWLLIV